MSSGTLDLHLHTIASGHGSKATITDMAKEARCRGMTLVGLSDHGPATLGSARTSYFRSLSRMTKNRLGIPFLYGVELNILDKSGRVDLPDDILSRLDYGIASLHTQNMRPSTEADHTAAYIKSMSHPNVRIIGHCDDEKFPVDLFALFCAAMEKNVILEINESSLAPGGYRGDTKKSALTILNLSVHFHYPVLFGSDSHGTKTMGEFPHCRHLAKLAEVPSGLILNDNIKAFKKWLNS